MLDTIIIKNAQFDCKIGCRPGERDATQKVIINIEMQVDTSTVVESGNLEDGVCYSTMHEKTKEIVENGEHVLVENVAELIAQMILKHHLVQLVMVRVEKPEALAERNVESVGIEIVRMKE